jgi:hypothetical protein
VESPVNEYQNQLSSSVREYSAMASKEIFGEGSSSSSSSSESSSEEEAEVQQQQVCANGVL